jgi:hypothetical protein
METAELCARVDRLSSALGVTLGDVARSRQVAKLQKEDNVPVAQVGDNAAFVPETAKMMHPVLQNLIYCFFRLTWNAQERG